MGRTADIAVPAFAATPGAPTVVTADAGVWTITVPAKASFDDNDNFTIDDDINTPVVFEFDFAGDGVTGGRTQVDISGDTTAEDVRDTLLAAITAEIVAETLDVTAVALDTDKIVVTMTTPVTGAITEDVTDAGFTATELAAGATTRAYKIVGVYASGRVTAASSAGTATDGAAALSALKTQHITWTDPLDAGADLLVSVRVYRTTAGGTPNTTGLIATVAAGVELYDDIGAAGDASTAPTSNTTGDGDATNCLHYRDKTVMLHAVGTGTYQLQGSLDNSTWVNEGSALTATSTAAIEVSETYAYLRWKCTAYTSGTPTSMLAGHYEG